MTQVRMDIETIVVGGGPVASMVVLRPRNPRLTDGNLQLPIQIGLAEASAISMGMDDSTNHRPFTHDLLKNVVSELGSTISSVGIDRVEGATSLLMSRLFVVTVSISTWMHVPLMQLL